MDSSYSAELAIGLAAVRAASSLTKTLLRSSSKHLSEANASGGDAISKDDLSPVTVGDFAIQALLTSAISSRFPGDKFVGEEGADALREDERLGQRVWEVLNGLEADVKANADDDAAAAESVKLAFPKSKEDMFQMIDFGGKGEGGSQGRVWVFDPIDGTATFMRGEQYAVNLALMVEGKQQLAVLGCPNLAVGAPDVQESIVDGDGEGCILFAVKGHGAYVQHMSAAMEDAKRLPRHAEKVDSLKDLKFTDCTTTTSTALPLHAKIAAALLSSGAIASTASSDESVTTTAITNDKIWPTSDLWSSLMKYASLTLGHTNVCMRVFKHRHYKSYIWDHAGGILLFEEVGGKITDLDGKDIDLSLGRKISGNFGLLCAPKHLHAEILEKIQEILRAEGVEVPL